MPKTTRKRLPSDGLTLRSSKVFGVRIPNDLKNEINVDFKRRLRLDRTVPAIYTVAEHVRFLIREGLYRVNYPSK